MNVGAALSYKYFFISRRLFIKSIFCVPLLIHIMYLTNYVLFDFPTTPNTKKVVWNPNKHKQLSSLFLTGADRPRSMWPINPYCAHISPDASSFDIPSTMTHAELLVCLVLHLCISKVFHWPAPPTVVDIYDECSML